MVVTTFVLECCNYTRQEYDIESYDDHSCVLVSVSDKIERTFQIAKNTTQYYVRNKFFVPQTTLLKILQKKIPNFGDFDFVEIPFEDKSWRLLPLGNRDSSGSTIVTLKYIDKDTYVGYESIKDSKPYFEYHLDDSPVEVSEQDMEVEPKKDKPCLVV